MTNTGSACVQLVCTAMASLAPCTEVVDLTDKACAGMCPGHTGVPAPLEALATGAIADFACVPGGPWTVSKLAAERTWQSCNRGTGGVNDFWKPAVIATPDEDRCSI